MAAALVNSQVWGGGTANPVKHRNVTGPPGHHTLKYRDQPNTPLCLPAYVTRHSLSFLMSQTGEDIDVIVSLPDGVDLDGAYEIFVSMVGNAMVGA